MVKHRHENLPDGGIFQFTWYHEHRDGRILELGGGRSGGGAWSPRLRLSPRSLRRVFVQWKSGTGESMRSQVRGQIFETIFPQQPCVSDPLLR